MIKLKIGEQFVFKKDFETESFLGNKITIKEGSVGIVSTDGTIHMRNGKILPLSKEEFEIEDYDTENISKYIYDRISNYIGKSMFKEMLEGYDISPDDLIEQIEDTLIEIF